jgi:hypothetical protein
LNLIPSVLTSEIVRDLANPIDTAYREVAAARSVAPFAAPNLPVGEKFVPTASFFTIGAILSASDLNSLLSSLHQGPIGTPLRRQLGDNLVCAVDHSWIRRQYAPRNYPSLHAPHGWHQDGALGFDFLSYPEGNYPADAMLRMVTCWIALDPCGVESPGLELITQKQTRLLPPAELSHAWIREQFPPEHFWRPPMQPGDALLFPGDVLHRTHVTPAMTRDRTSLELRFFPDNDFPRRLKTSRLARL